MKLSAFSFRLKISVPNFKESAMTPSEVAELFSQATNQVNLYCKVYKTYTDFNVVANQQIYALSTIATTYLGMDKKVIYLKDSAGKWQPVLPKTKDWISKRYPQWLNASSVALPQWYWIEEDEMGLYPPPSTAYTAGGRIYHLKKGTEMGNDDFYPFTGSAVELTALLPLDDAILAYCRWKLSPAVGAVTDQDLRWQEFIKECARGMKQIHRRPDITNHETYQLST